MTVHAVIMCGTCCSCAGVQERVLKTPECCLMSAAMKLVYLVLWFLLPAELPASALPLLSDCLQHTHCSYCLLTIRASLPCNLVLLPAACQGKSS